MSTEIKETLKLENNKKEKGKEISFSKGYFIYKDGRCFSEKSNRFLVKRKSLTNNPAKYYYSYDISSYGNCLVTRLVMFAYGDHNYENIREMPKVIQIDGDPENLNIENLKFATQSEINKINNVRPPKYMYGTRSTIDIANKKIIENLLENKMTYKKISEIFETSEMSVYRFVKNHIKKKNTISNPTNL